MNKILIIGCTGAGNHSHEVDFPADLVYTMDIVRVDDGHPTFVGDITKSNHELADKMYSSFFYSYMV